MQVLINVVGQFEFLPGDDILSSAAAANCRKNSLFTSICKNVLFLFGGFNSELFDDVNISSCFYKPKITDFLFFQSKLELILEHTPAGASAAQIIHYGQLMRTTRFQKYDHGILSNLRLYGSLRPPIYRLERITASVALHYGRNDLFADVKDVLRLSKRLPNLFGLYPVPHPRFNHFDFLWAKSVRELLYNRLVVVMKTAE